MIVTFTGWVPTITGNLSFSTIGLGRSPRRAFSFFRKLDESQWTVVVQSRNKSDTLFSRVIDPIRRKRAKHFFFMLGKSESSDSWDSIHGHVFICSPELFKTTRPLLFQLQEAGDSNDNERIEPASHDLNAHREIKRQRIENWIDRLRDRLAREAGTSDCFLVGFRLSRNGKVEIHIDKDLFATAEEADTIAVQSYFFIKDITHAHQHHNRNSDTILEAYEGEAGNPTWQRETMYALYKWIIHRKRERSEISYTRAAGVLAYARAFSSLHLADVRRPDDVPHYLFDEVELSLEAGRKEAAARSAEKSGSLLFRSWFTALTITVVLMVLSILTSLNAMDTVDLSHQSGQRRILSEIAKYLVLNPISSLVAFLGLTWVAGQLSRPKASFLTRPKVLDIFRIAYSMNYFLVLGLSGIATLGAGYLIVQVFLRGFG